jgi:maltooligosyltrehalose trehalohydrolase
MTPLEGGLWTATLQDIKPKTEYMYLLNDTLQRPDPASSYQPHGVFGPSEVVDHSSFEWTDDQWRGLDLWDLVFYEVHTGTFSEEGTFGGVQKRVRELAELGINAIELMPLSQFSGQRGWGYDGVFPFAVYNSYGTPDDLKALVNECHRNRVALFVDIVYNHFGPEGNFLRDFAPYFSSQKTLWGSALNLDGPNCEGVRNFLMENALHWLRDYHLDSIRLDSVLHMYDQSPNPFLAELNQKVKSYSEQHGVKVHTIAETGYNVPRVLADTSRGGFGFDAQWLDSFHHALFALITGEQEGYYKYYGQVSDFADIITDAYAFVGDQASFRRRGKNESFRSIPAYKFVAFSQNHDQIGNRMMGDRLISISGFESAKLALGMTLLSPYVPLLFMGEDYGETAPFQFFTDYQDKELQKAVVEGRAREFSAFHWKGEVPNPQSPGTFDKSKINWNQRHTEKGAQMLGYVRDLLTLRKQPAFALSKNRKIDALEFTSGQMLSLSKGGGEAVVLANFCEEKATYCFPYEGKYQKTIDSSSQYYGGPGETLPKDIGQETCACIPAYGIAVYNRLKR